MKILISGDIHGNYRALNYLQKEVKKQIPDCNTCIQVGDFGFYPSIMEREGFLSKFAMETYVIDGNHEDHSWLRRTIDEKRHEEWKTNFNLNFVDRGKVLKFGTSNIAFLGGAMNVDRPNNGDTNLKTNNYISDEDIISSLQVFNEIDIDLMVTHSCPNDIGVGMVGHPCFIPYINKYVIKAHNLPDISLHDCGEHALHKLWSGLNKKPKLWVYGHFHKIFQSIVDTTEFICVGTTDMSSGQEYILPFIYDTDTKHITVGDKIEHYMV